MRQFRQRIRFTFVTSDWTSQHKSYSFLLYISCHGKRQWELDKSEVGGERRRRSPTYFRLHETVFHSITSQITLKDNFFFTPRPPRGHGPRVTPFRCVRIGRPSCLGRKTRERPERVRTHRRPEGRGGSEVPEAKSNILCTILIKFCKFLIRTGIVKKIDEVNVKV